MCVYVCVTSCTDGACNWIVGQVFMGLARFGFLASLLSWPVMSGFTSASACIIGVSQFKYFFGIPSSGSGFFEKLLDVAVGLPGLHVPTTLLSLFTLLCLMAAKSKLRLPKWFPMQLLLIIATTALSYMVDLESHGVAIVGEFPASGLRSESWHASAVFDPSLSRTPWSHRAHPEVLCTTSYFWGMQVPSLLASPLQSSHFKACPSSCP